MPLTALKMNTVQTLFPRLFGYVALILVLSACGSIQPPTQANYPVSIQADGKNLQISVPAGSTAQLAVDRSGIKLNPLDRLTPPGYTVLNSGDTIKVIRVKEEFDIEEKTIPFESQTVKNESMAEGQTMLIQPGVNGVEQITYRRVLENDVEISRAIFKTVMLTEPKPEIMMVGVQKPFTPISIPTRLVYLAGGNAWAMEETTGNRRPVVTSGDLDGYIFSLSPDGTYLLFTRKSSKPQSEEINTLWMIDLTDKEAKPVNLRASNIVHYGSWVPGKGIAIAYSTVEPRSTPPGWQANNDLVITRYSPSGIILETTKVLEANSGGVYGWWGSSYAWSPDGAVLAYARPDGVGLIDVENGNQQPLIDITPYQTQADWAWVTGLGWAPDHRVIYFVTHPPKAGLNSAEASPIFDLTAMVIDGGTTINLGPQSGMFSYPVTSPMTSDGDYLVAFLQSIFPEQSDTGRYHLVVMDRDGSNRKTVFPAEGLPGLEPQQVVWAKKASASGEFWIALTYQGNLWLVNPISGDAQQITGDGLMKRIDW
jgi:Tol biopolymer transport system component